jgi:hypothetical protein
MGDGWMEQYLLKLLNELLLMMTPEKFPMYISIYILWTLNKSLKDLTTVLGSHCNGLSGVYGIITEIAKHLEGSPVDPKILVDSSKKIDFCLSQQLIPIPIEVKNDKR